MSKAGPGKIFIDTATKLEAENTAGMMFETMPSLTLKGFEKPVECFSPIFGGGGGQPAPGLGDEASNNNSTRRMSRRPTTGGQGSSSIGGAAQSVVGMHAEQAALCRASFLTGPPLRAVFLEGDAGSGKTHLIQNAIAETPAKHIFFSLADASETSTPFFVWRALLQDMLSIVLPKKEAPSPQITAGHKRSQSASLMPQSGSPNTKKKSGLATHASYDPPEKSNDEVDDDYVAGAGDDRRRAGSDLPSNMSSPIAQRRKIVDPLDDLTTLNPRERSDSDLTPSSRVHVDSSLLDSPQSQAKKRRSGLADQLRAPVGVGRTIRALSSALIKTSSVPHVDAAEPAESQVPVIRTPSQSSLKPGLGSTFHPDNSLLLERMRDSGKLAGFLFCTLLCLTFSCPANWFPLLKRPHRNPPPRPWMKNPWLDVHLNLALRCRLRKALNLCLLQRMRAHQSLFQTLKRCPS